MNKVGITVFAGVAMLVGVSAQVQAGGMYETYGSYKDPVSAAVVVPAPMPIPETTAWYIRGDLGYAAYQEPDMHEVGGFDLTNTGIDGTWSVGGGVGYYFGSRLRGDITVDYIADSEVTATNPNAAAPVGGGIREFDLRSTVALANVYYDFDRYAHFSPYVGVGIGLASNQTSAGRAEGATYANGTSGTIDGGSDTNFALALMAGATIELRKGLRLDANYRYLYIGGGQTGNIRDTTVDVNVLPVLPRIPVNGGAINIDDMHVHQIRVGFRQDIW